LQPAKKLIVVGIGYKPLGKKASDALAGADIVLASRRLVEVFRKYEEFSAVEGKMRVINNIEETMSAAREAAESKAVVLLASGDPLFFGIGRKAMEVFGKDAVEIIPELSSMQVAFSRIGEAWDDAFLMSLHGGPDPLKRRRLPYTVDDLPLLLEKHGKLAVLTDRENNPSLIAGVISRSPDVYSMSPMLHVCEKLGYDDEKITSGRPEQIAGITFQDPNVVIIIASREARMTGNAERKDSAPFFGLTEGEISHSRGLITKDEIRAVAIHKLKLPEGGVVWDIGAGSGSVSLEIARLCPGIRVFAVEKDSEQLVNIRRNRITFSALNIEVVEGDAPPALESLPAPDRVFVGGSGGMLEDIIQHVSRSMVSASGIIVINVTKIDSLHEATEALRRAGFTVDVSQVSVSRTRAAGEGEYLSALNPVFVIRGKKNRSGGI
jgi:precorrin-6Y C5,15-methyltransferase (decarboxylating)